MNNYTYTIKDKRNAFGAHLGLVVTLYCGDKKVRRWEFDDLAFGEMRATKRVRKLQNLYGATIQKT